MNKSTAEFKSIFEQNGFVNLKQAATIHNGIVPFDHWFNALLSNQNNKIWNLCKFVPASGAATRLFKGLEDLNSPLFNEVFDQKEKFPCFHEVKDKSELLEAIQNLKQLPKGAIQLHQKSLFEEQILELEGLVSNLKNLSSQIHFTLPEAYQLNLAHPFSSSVQNPDTNVPSWDIEQNDFFRDEHNALVLRPGGHGALLPNLNAIDAEVIWIKNIDNLTHPDYHTEQMEILTQFFLFAQEVKNKIDQKLKALHEGVATLDLDQQLISIFPNMPEEKAELITFLNRPFRVAGMVKNEGAPGGGPFWVTKNGKDTLQIVEQAQIDVQNPDQKAILDASTHFNPVQMFCFVRDYNGVKYDLENFADPEAFFLSEKSVDGKEIKIFEHPGLWNGAMYDHLSLFIELPLITFAPVKSIKDNLNPLHQPK